MLAWRGTGIRPPRLAHLKSQLNISDPVPLPVAVKIVRYSCRELVLVDDLYPYPFRYAGTLRYPHYRRRQG